MKKQARHPSRAADTPQPFPAALEPDLRQAEKTLMDLLSIPGPSGREGKVVEYIVKSLRRAGAPAGAIRTDQAHRRSPLGGEVGNLVCRLPGSRRGPRRLLMAHMDTVPLAVGARPVVRRDQIAPADKHTALGGDDRSGVAVVLTAALEILRRGLPHPPLTLLWTVQEECGLLGARWARVSALGAPRLAFNFDGSEYHNVGIGATGGYRLVIDVHGIASHAGVHPERGASAITIASLAIARLHREGWLGLVQKDGLRGTSNVGVIEGGDATNVVTPHVRLRAEARSHDPAFRRQIVHAIKSAFAMAAGEVRNEDGAAGRVAFDGRLDYESFRLAEDTPVVGVAEKAIRAVGGQPERTVSNGGLDANWITARVAPTVTLGAGQIGAHTVQERLRLATFRQACRVALRLGTATEGVD
ncbi:MAG: M20/M25/M40 family metallo-hydrolase [Pirellulales bacterium]|nr:M20/M25/M40 family metallo-hydrolase [Pirellulales bacterium]